MALNPGDIGFVAYNADGAKSFAFVALVDISAGEDVHFTDRGWLRDNSGFFNTANDSTLTWTAPAAGVVAGTVITLAGSTASTGTIDSNVFDLSTSGDQILAYQGDVDAPSQFLVAINNNNIDGRFNFWDSDAYSEQVSALPPGLTNGSTAISIEEVDNVAYTGPTTGTREELLPLLHDNANWTARSDTANQSFPGNFTIDETDDDIAPGVLNLIPTDNAIDVQVDDDLMIVFEEPIQLGSGSIRIKSDATDTVVETIPITSDRITPNSDRLTIDPTVTLDFGQTYYVEIDDTAISDLAGNFYVGIDNKAIWNFTTAAASDTTAPTNPTFSPSDDGENVAIDGNLMLTFSETVQTQTGNITIYNASGVVETINVATAQVTVNDKTVTINPTVSLDYATDYYVQIDDGSIQDLAGNDYSGIADNATWNFSTEAAPDITAPTVSTYSPTPDATQIAAGADLVLSFDEDVQVGTGNITIHRASDDAVVATIPVGDAQVDITGAVVTINPTADLDNETDYYVQVAAGAITDLSGNPFAGLTGPTAWSFTTADVTAPTFTLDTPTDDASQVSVGTDLSFIFSEPVQKGTGNILIKDGSDDSVIASIPVSDAQVTVSSTTVTIDPTLDLSDKTSVYVEIPGSAFTDLEGNPFAGISGTDTWNFTTEDNTAPVLNTQNPVDDAASVAVDADLILTFDEEIQKGTGNILIKQVGGDSLVATIPVGDAQVSVSGGTVTIDPISPLDEDTEYYVEIPSTAFTDLEGNAFAGLSGNTAWSFTTADDTAPTVSSFAPVDNGTAIAIDTDLSLTLSEDMKLGTGNILIKETDGNSVVATIDVTSGAVTISGATVTIDPPSNLDYETDYYIEIPSGALLDLADNPYGGTADAATWNFTTDVAPDLTAPTLADIASPLSPSDDAGNVAVDADLSITLSEDVKTGTGNIVVKASADDAAVETINVTSGAVTVSGATVTINPTANLDYATGYYIEVDDGAFLDLADNAYAGITGNAAWNFTTENDYGVTVTQLSGPLVEGVTDTYTIALDVIPTGAVVIDLAADIQTEISVDGTTFVSSLGLTLTDTTPQTITVRVIDDADVEASNHSGSISHSITSSVDPNYTALAIESVTVNITDNDTAPAIPDLFISEYVEGSSNNKAIELYNPTDNPINLTGDNYTIEIYSNGETTPSNTINLGGMIASGDTFVVADDAADTSITDVTDQINGGTFFNGNDAIALYKNGVLIDSLGQRGVDPGDAWSSGGISTQDQTLRRKSTITSGDTNTLDAFDPVLEWESFAQDNVDRLGSHNDDAPRVNTFSVDGGDFGPDFLLINVPVDSDIGYIFTEAVDVTGDWFTLSGSISGAITATVTGFDKRYTLNPDSDFAPGETITVTLNAAQVTDQDGIVDELDSTYDYTYTFIVGGITPIHEIQGSGSASAEAGNIHTVEGIITYVTSAGFFVQEEDSDVDGDDATSEGIFVFSNETVAVGDRVQVTGTVDEYFNLTQLKDVSNVIIQSSGNDLPTALSVDLPLASAEALEPYEGMLITLPQTLTVTDVYDLGRGGLVEVSSGGVLEQPTHTMMPGSDAVDQQSNNDLNRLIIDDGSEGQNPDPILYPGAGLSATNTLRVGDTATGITGVMSEAWSGWDGTDAYRVFPTVAPTFVADNPRPVTPEDVGGSLTVATFNLQNFFNGDGAGGGVPTSRGASSLTEVAKQGEKLVAAIATMDADVLALQELENDYGDGENSAIASLVTVLNAVMGAGTYDYVDPGTAVGDDDIAVGVIYKPEAVSIAAGTTVEILEDSDLSGLGLGSLGTVFDGVNTNRAPLAVTFAENSSGEQFTVAVNHLKSKSDGGLTDVSDPNYDQNDGQSFWSQMRVNGVTALDAWLETNPTGTDDPDVLILGDLNSYTEEDPITALETAGYTHQVTDYTYSYDGQRGTLDYALSSASLTTQVTGVTAWHINADEPKVLDYNEEFKSAGQQASLFNPDPYRSSDHDPVLIGLNLASTSPEPQPEPEPEPEPEPVPTPPRPPQPQLTNGFDTGVSNSDRLTNQNKPQFSGTAEPGGTLELFANGQFLGTAPVNAQGAWFFTPPQAFADGTYTITTTVTVEGETSPVSVATQFTVDTEAAKGTISDVTPNIRDTPLDQIQIQFTEAIAQFDISDLTLTRNGANVSLAGVTLTQSQSLNWSLGNLEAVTTEAGVYQLTMTPGDITDQAGNPISTVVQSWETGQLATPLDVRSLDEDIPGRQTVGTNGRDILRGSRGKDILRGGRGNDVLIAGKGDDGNGQDELYGQAGDDFLKGGNGKDLLSGGAGRDRLKGGKNVDTLLGGNGNDVLIGGRGHDLLTGGKGKDKIKGGKGQDTIIYKSLKEGVDTIIGFELTNDLIDLSAIFSKGNYPAESTFEQFKTYVSLVQSGRATEIQVATNKNANDFATLAKMRGIQADTLSAQNFILE